METRENIEIEKIKAETISIKIQRNIDIAKSILLVISTFVLFWVIQEPEFILNKKISEENINRERAKMLLELLKNDRSDEQIYFGILSIKEAYPNNNQWLNKISNIYATKLAKEIMKKKIIKENAKNKKRLQTIKGKLSELYSKREHLESKFLEKLSWDKESEKNELNQMQREIDKIIYKIDDLKEEYESLESK